MSERVCLKWNLFGDKLFYWQNAYVFRSANVKAGTWHQHWNEERCFASGFPSEHCSLEQELPTTEPTQRHLHLDQHSTSSLSEPKAGSWESKSAKVSAILCFQGQKSWTVQAPLIKIFCFIASRIHSLFFVPSKHPLPEYKRNFLLK